MTLATKSASGASSMLGRAAAPAVEVEGRVPAEAAHVNPDSAAKTASNSADSTPEVSAARGLSDCRVLEVGGNPVREMAIGHAQSPQETVEVLTPVGIISGGS